MRSARRLSNSGPCQPDQWNGCGGAGAPPYDAAPGALLRQPDQIRAPPAERGIAVGQRGFLRTKPSPSPCQAFWALALPPSLNCCRSRPQTSARNRRTPIATCASGSSGGLADPASQLAAPAQAVDRSRQQAAAPQQAIPRANKLARIGRFSTRSATSSLPIWRHRARDRLQTLALEQRQTGSASLDCSAARCPSQTCRPGRREGLTAPTRNCADQESGAVSPLLRGDETKWRVLPART